MWCIVGSCSTYTGSNPAPCIDEYPACFFLCGCMTLSYSPHSQMSITSKGWDICVAKHHNITDMGGGMMSVLSCHSHVIVMWEHARMHAFRYTSNLSRRTRATDYHVRPPCSPAHSPVDMRTRKRFGSTSTPSNQPRWLE
jgi:hypothetical protein